MRYMQVVESRDVHGARNTYIDLLAQRGVELTPSMTVFVETVHRAQPDHGSWLCYVAYSMQAAA